MSKKKIRVSYRIFCYGGGKTSWRFKCFDMGWGGGGGGRETCLTEIMTSEIQNVSANKLAVNKFQLSY